MTDASARAGRFARAFAWAWLLVVVVLAAHQVQFWRAGDVDADVLALLPGADADPALRRADERIAAAATDQVVVVLAADDWTRTRAAAEAFLAALPADGPLQPLAAGAGLDDALAFYAPHRAGVLSDAQRDLLRASAPDELAQHALARLFAPGAGAGFGRWQDDPLGLWPAWWQARAGDGVGVRDDLLAASDGAREHAVLRLRSSASAFRLDGEAHLRAALDAATAAAAAAADGPLAVRFAGVPLHAEAAAVRAGFEMSTIGLGSLLAVITLVWAAFRTPRPVVLVAVSLIVGTAAGVSATVLVFGKVHLLTLVFGASLVGVAEDYGLHWFSCRQGWSQVPPRSLLRQLLPGLVLALATSVVAYLAMGLAPLPGLQQMAVFAAAGLTAAFLTAIAWFPVLDRGAPDGGRFARAIGASLGRWPRWRPGFAGWAIVLALAATVAAGLVRLRTDDTLRTLQASPAALVADERAVGELLGLPSPAQYFLVTAPDAETLLQREEALTSRLRPLVADDTLAGWQALSDWVPSQARQQADRALVAPAEAAARALAAQVSGEPEAFVPTAATAAAPLVLPEFLSRPVSEPVRALWLGDVPDGVGSAVLLRGVTPATLPALATRADGLPGVRFVDRSAGYAELLQTYRWRMTVLLVAGYVGVAVLLAWRYGRPAWRALLPTAAASALALAGLAWAGVPLQLFVVLALLLLLGIGVDYGIFLLEHRDDGASWLAVCLGAASTLLAFGLLALSATPALHAFGLTLLIGIGAVWLLSPCLRLDADPASLH